MKQQIIDLLNNKYPDDKEYTGFTLLAHNAEGVRLLSHNISPIELMLQVTLLSKEVKEQVEEIEDVRH